MKSRILSGLLVLMAVAFLSKAEVFNVTNVEELRDALATAESNGEDDVINLLPGNYQIETKLIYRPVSSENYSLTIKGEDLSTTVVDGQNISKIFYINLRRLTDDSVVNIKFENITFTKAFDLAYGGAISIEAKEANLEVNNCKFTENDAPYGGAIFVLTQGNTSIINSEFIDNKGKVGGAIMYLPYEGNLLIERNKFKGNSSRFGGAIYLMSTNGRAILKSNTFEENIAEVDGGGLSASLSNMLLIIMNNIFYKNVSETEFGGGLYINTGSNQVFLVNNTIAYNEAVDNGGGLYLSLNNGGSIAYIFNNIIKYNKLDNENPIGEDVYINNVLKKDNEISVSEIDFYNNNIGENTDLMTSNSEDLFILDTSKLYYENNITDNPLFIDSENGNLHLQNQSPCVDAGNNDIFDKLLELEIEVPEDIDGDPRIYKDVVDIGADEVLLPEIQVSPEMLDFGTFNVGDEPVSKTFTVTNTGYGTLKFKKVIIWGINKNYYEISENECIDKGELLSGESCNVTVTFYPKAIGDKRAFVGIISNDPIKKVFSYKMNSVVRAEKEPVIVAEPIKLSFEETLVPEVAIVTNKGNSELIIPKIVIWGINKEEFEIVNENCKNKEIEPGSSCEISVIFKPQTKGNKKGLLVIYSNDPDKFMTKIPLRYYKK